MYSFTPLGDSLFQRSNGGLEGIYKRLVYSFLPSTKIVPQAGHAMSEPGISSELVQITNELVS